MIVAQKHPLQTARGIGLSKKEFRQLMRMTACHSCLTPLEKPPYEHSFLVMSPDYNLLDCTCKLCPDCAQLLDYEHDRLVDDQDYKTVVLRQVSTNRKVGLL